VVKGVAGFMFAAAVAGCGAPQGATPAAVAPSTPATTVTPSSTSDTPLIPLSVDAMPATPEFAAALIGKPLAGSGVATTNTCFGNADLVSMRFTAPGPGAAIIGWAWNAGAMAPYANILVLNHGGIVQGAGVGGSARPDVVLDRADVTSELVGWTAYVLAEPGMFTLWGYDPVAKTACKVGEIAVL
jgi:hypothetical protein